MLLSIAAFEGRAKPLAGADASCIPLGERKNARWFDGDTPTADPVVFRVDQAVEALWLRVRVGIVGSFSGFTGEPLDGNGLLYFMPYRITPDQLV